MAWNETDREKYAVLRTRYASDLSDEEFSLVQPLLPIRKPLGRKADRRRGHPQRRVLYGPMRLPFWRVSPKEFPPITTVQNRFYAWRDSGLWERVPLPSWLWRCGRRRERARCPR